MSSFKGEEQKQWKLSHEENIEIRQTNFSLNGRNKKDGYINCDQLF